MLNCPDFEVFWGFVPRYPFFSLSDPAELTFVPYMGVSRLAPGYRSDAPTRIRKDARLSVCRSSYFAVRAKQPMMSASVPVNHF